MIEDTWSFGGQELDGVFESKESRWKGGRSAHR